MSGVFRTLRVPFLFTETIPSVFSEVISVNLIVSSALISPVVSTFTNPLVALCNPCARRADPSVSVS